MQHPLPNPRRGRDLHERLHLQVVDQADPVRHQIQSGITLRVVCFGQNVAEDVEAALLQVVYEIDEGARRSGAVHQEEDLGAPEFHVVFAGIEEKEVLSNLLIIFV